MMQCCNSAATRQGNDSKEAFQALQDAYEKLCAYNESWLPEFNCWHVSMPCLVGISVAGRSAEYMQETETAEYLKSLEGWESLAFFGAEAGVAPEEGSDRVNEQVCSVHGL